MPTVRFIAGVSVDNVTIVGMSSPSAANASPSPFAMDFEVSSQDAVRAVSSLRNADSFGVLKTRMRSEAHLNLISTDVAVLKGPLRADRIVDLHFRCIVSDRFIANIEALIPMSVVDCPDGAQKGGCPSTRRSGWWES